MKLTNMQKKITLGIVILILILVGTWVVIMEERKPAGILLEPVEETEREQGIVSTGYGWSVKSEPREAIREAIALAVEDLAGQSPEYVILFSTVGYGTDEVVKELEKQLPSAQIYGGTSMFGVITKDGYHIGRDASLALLAIFSPEVDFGVGGADINNFSAKEAGKRAALAAIKNAGGQEDAPDLILITAAPGHEEEIIEGIEEIVGKETPIVGGSSADNDISGQWKQFANNNVYSNGVSLTAIYTNLKIGMAYEAGYLKSENSGIITEAEGRTIYKINNKPAAEVYNEWTDGLITDKLKTGGSILSDTNLYPLAKVIKGKTTTNYLSIHPLSVDLPGKSLTMFANVEKGEEILLMRGNWELLLNRAQTVPQKALASKHIPEEKVAFGIYTFCAGTMLVIPEDERQKIPLLINSVIGGAPFIGAFTFGEQGFIPEAGNKHGNLVSSMVIFSQEQ